MLSVIVISIITAIYVLLGRLGMSRLARERASLKPPQKLPLVSIIIPAYNSQKTIAQTLKSAKAIDYPKKEIIVVNDSSDGTPAIARSYGARVIQNRKRIGKSAALNRAAGTARGELLFFLDADTTVSRDSLKWLVPWFSEKDVAAVMPRYHLRNNHPVARLANIENIFTFALLKVHMFFRSIGGFRGCSIIIRSDVLKDHPWPDTLMEDNHLAATLLSRGYRIIWEPLSTAYTTEPETREEIKCQKRRWGEGAYLAFRRHRRYYLRSPQFMIFFYPYFALGIATGLLTFSLLLSPFLFPSLTAPITTELILIFISMHFHTLIFLYVGSGEFLPARTLRFMVMYFPVMTYSYFRGVLSGIKRKKRGKNELHFRHW